MIMVTNETFEVAYFKNPKGHWKIDTFNRMKPLNIISISTIH
jgi:hypothetical protein